MNQILYTGINNEKNNSQKNSKSFKFLLYISLFLFISTTSYFSVYLYNSKKQEKFTSALINSFNIDSLYSNEQNYTVVKLNNSDEANVIGIIQIDKINILKLMMSFLKSHLASFSVRIQIK